MQYAPICPRTRALLAVSTLFPLIIIYRSIPSSYIHALECFVAAKQEYLSQNPSSESQSLSTTYSYQHKYISALLKQLPPGTVFPAASRSILLHPPTTMKTSPLRQGPFLLQPAPLTLEGSEDGDATDILYLSFDNDDENDDDGETERLGVVLVVTQDGKVDVCLDVDKVEARWETRQVSMRRSTNVHGLDFHCSPRMLNCLCWQYMKLLTLALSTLFRQLSHLPSISYRVTILSFYQTQYTGTPFMCITALEYMLYISTKCCVPSATLCIPSQVEPKMRFWLHSAALHPLRCSRL